MTRARRVSAGIIVVGLLCFAGGGGTLAGIPKDGSAGLRTASASTTTEARIHGQQRLLMEGFRSRIFMLHPDQKGQRLVSSATVKSRTLKLQGTHPSSVHLLRQHEWGPQTSDLYVPSHSSHLQLLRYPLWFQFCPATNDSEVFTRRTIAQAPLSAL
jgi:hypothetical protein